MLVVYTQQLAVPQQELLISWQSWVDYWPRSVSMRGMESATALDWYLLFHNQFCGLQWIMQWPEHSLVICKDS